MRKRQRYVVESNVEACRVQRVSRMSVGIRKSNSNPKKLQCNNLCENHVRGIKALCELNSHKKNEPFYYIKILFCGSPQLG